MVDWIIKKWEQNKSKLRERLARTPQEEYDQYLKLLKIVLDEIVNNEKPDKDYGFCYKTISTKDIQQIDYGDYQGTLIFVFHQNTYKPDKNETFYTVVDYGSCSVCDTLMGISDYDCGSPTEKQLNDYMTLCLHLVQNIKCFEQDYNTWENID